MDAPHARVVQAMAFRYHMAVGLRRALELSSRTSGGVHDATIFTPVVVEELVLALVLAPVDAVLLH